VLEATSAENRWEVADCLDLEGVAYGKPFEYANGITVGSVRKA
jgi:hypothetical protein